MVVWDQNVPIGQAKFLACKDDTSPRCIGNVQFLATHTSSVAFGTLGHYISLGHWEVIHVRLCLHLNSWNKLGQYSNGTKCLKNWCKASTAWTRNSNLPYPWPAPKPSPTTPRTCHTLAYHTPCLPHPWLTMLLMCVSVYACLVYGCTIMHTIVWLHIDVIDDIIMHGDGHKGC